MKSRHSIYGAVALLFAGFWTAFAIPPRKDINPALLYWQAFSLFPELDESESGLLSVETTGEVSAEERALARGFDASFAFIRRARGMTVRCDWGMDVSDGPEAIVPNFKKIRTAVSAALLRARVALADGHQAQARDELLAVSVLGRYAATDASLVGAMVQISVDAKILDFIAIHFDQLASQTRAEITAGLNGSPRRTTVADAMLNEQTAFYEWLLANVEGFRAADRDDARVLDQFRDLVGGVFSHDNGLADRIIAAAGGTSTGLVRYIKGVEPYYERSMAIAKSSDEDIKRRMAEFEVGINASTNLIALVAMPNVGKARLKELEFQARLAKLPDAAP